MKISKISIRNLFGIREFDSNGKSIELDGKNGVGKSAVIDSIIYALTNKADREYLIRAGENEGEVIVETDSGIRIHRKARNNKVDYKSIQVGNDPTQKTESFLREIYTPLQLDPVTFASMDSKEQNRIILDLIDFKWDMNWIKEQFGEIPHDVNYEQNILRVLHEIQSDKGYYFQKREDINRDRRHKTSFIQEIGASLPPNYDAKTWESVTLGDIYKQIESIRSNNEWIEKAKAAVKAKDGKLRGFEAEYEIDKNAIDKETTSTRTALERDIASMESKIKEYRTQLTTLEEKKLDKLQIAKKTYEANMAELEGEVKQYEELSQKELGNSSPLQEEVDNAERMKSHINEYNRMKELEQEVVKLELDSQELTGKIEKARTLPGEILSQCTIPIAGLTIRDGDPLINNLPISNLSEGEKMDLCIDVTIAKEGALKMILIDGIERLATTKRNDVYKKIKSKGIQFIATRTTDDDLLTVIEL